MAAIAFDATANGSIGASSLTYSHTCTGSNRILFVGVSITGTSDILTGITYNGVAMTVIDKSQEAVGSRWAYLYYLINPSTGANNVVVSCSGSTTIESGSVSYTGVKQSGQPDASGKKTTNGVTSQALAVTSVTDNCWMVSYCQCRLVGNPIAGTNVTNRNSIGGGSGIGDSNGVIHPAGSFSQTWTQSSSEEFNVIQASFSPSLTTSNINYAFLM